MPARELTTSTPEATEALGEALGRAVSGGELIGLTGELGAGKTCLVRGLARGLGIDPGRVHSPSFTIVTEYRGGCYSLPLPPERGTGLGKPLKLMTHPLRSSIPSRVRGWKPFAAMARATTQRSCGCMHCSSAKLGIRFDVEPLRWPTRPVGISTIWRCRPPTTRSSRSSAN